MVERAICLRCATKTKLLISHFALDTETKEAGVHHHHPEPFLFSMVLTSSSGYHIYCTVLTVYEMRDVRKIVQKDKQLKKGAKGTATFDKSDVHCWMVPKCLVLMSHYPFFQAQATALKELFYTVQSGASPLPFERYIAHLLEDVPLPRDGTGTGTEDRGHAVVEWTSWLRPRPATVRLEHPPPNRLPLLDVSLEPLFRTLSLSNVLVVWATLLREGRVVLSCARRETAALLAPVAEALVALLFPLEWRGLYVPVLPNRGAALDVLQAPVPYLVGLVRNPADSRTYAPQSQPSNVVWCDLDADVLHLGFKGDDTLVYREGEDVLPLLPALPFEAGMALKMELEELVDPLYLPTIEGVKGRITVGDRAVELDNASREPYAPRTKLFATPVATPRKYILMQSSAIPPRGTTLRRKRVPGDDDAEGGAAARAVSPARGLSVRDVNIPSKEEQKAYGNNASLGSSIVQEHIDRALAARDRDHTAPKDLGSKGEPNPFTSNQDPAFLLSLKEQGQFMQTQVDRALAALRQAGASKEPSPKEEPNPFAADEYSTFLWSLKQQGRIMQEHVDRAFAALGQDFATTRPPISEEESTAIAADQDSTFLWSLKEQGRIMQEHVDRALAALGQDFATTRPPVSEKESTSIAADQDSTFLWSLKQQGRIMQEHIDRALAGQDLVMPKELKQQGRYVQAHVDWALAVLGQDYATPSEYAVRSSQQCADVLQQQDEIAAKLFAVDGREGRELTRRVRESFLRFFLAVFKRYKFFLDPKTNQLDAKRFVAGLNLPQSNQDYIKEVVTSQMFDRFLQDTHSIGHRKLFDEYISKRDKGSFGRAGNSGSNDCHATPLLDSPQWNNPTVIIPEQPCDLGLKKGRIYCGDRQFPDRLDPDECITNDSFSF